MSGGVSLNLGREKGKGTLFTKWCHDYGWRHPSTRIFRSIFFETLMNRKIVATFVVWWLTLLRVRAVLSQSLWCDSLREKKLRFSSVCTVYWTSPFDLFSRTYFMLPIVKWTCSLTEFAYAVTRCALFSCPPRSAVRYIRSPSYLLPRAEWQFCSHVFQPRLLRFFLTAWSELGTYTTVEMVKRGSSPATLRSVKRSRRISSAHVGCVYVKELRLSPWSHAPVLYPLTHAQRLAMLARTLAFLNFSRVLYNAHGEGEEAGKLFPVFFFVFFVWKERGR